MTKQEKKWRTAMTPRIYRIDESRLRVFNWIIENTFDLKGLGFFIDFDTSEGDVTNYAFKTNLRLILEKLKSADE